MTQAVRVSLGELLTLERRPVKVENDQQYAEIGVYSFGKGIGKWRTVNGRMST